MGRILDPRADFRRLTQSTTLTASGRNQHCGPLQQADCTGRSIKGPAHLENTMTVVCGCDTRLSDSNPTGERPWDIYSNT